MIPTSIRVFFAVQRRKMYREPLNEKACSNNFSIRFFKATRSDVQQNHPFQTERDDCYLKYFLKDSTF